MIRPFGKIRAEHLRLGAAGENAACRLLKSKSYDILARNYKCSYGEIDIVARDGATLVFLEVKSRRDRTGARPARGLSAEQKKRIRRAGTHYLREIENPSVVYRFDLIEVVFSRYGIREIRQWQNHITPKDMTRRKW